MKNIFVGVLGFCILVSQHYRKKRSEETYLRDCMEAESSLAVNARRRHKTHAKKK